MLRIVPKLLVIAAMLFAGAFAVSAQVDAENGSPNNPDKKHDMPRSFSEILARHRSEQDAKDHDEMLERGNEALKISEQIELSVEKSKQISRQDKDQLDNLERIVIKIRKELGGSDDNEEIEKQPADLADAVKYLQTNAAKLLDELKKTTRFSISAAAIQTSNSVLRAVRFLRLKK